MPTLVVVKDRQLCPVPISGVFTLPAEDATVACTCPDQPCTGININTLPPQQRNFELLARQMVAQLIARQKARGREFTGRIALHGPQPSFDLNAHLVDVNASMWREAQRPDRNGDEHPELALDAVFEQDKAFSPYMDYRYQAEFLGYEYVTRQSVSGGLPL